MRFKYRKAKTIKEWLQENFIDIKDINWIKEESNSFCKELEKSGFEISDDIELIIDDNLEVTEKEKIGISIKYMDIHIGFIEKKDMELVLFNEILNLPKDKKNILAKLIKKYYGRRLL